MVKIYGDSPRWGHISIVSQKQFIFTIIKKSQNHQVYIYNPHLQSTIYNLH